VAKASERERDGRRITLRVSEELYNAIADAADERQWSVSHWVTHAVETQLGPVARAIPRKARRAPRGR
jgi:predicted HicB family RNase H-like nuclease